MDCNIFDLEETMKEMEACEAGQRAKAGLKFQSMDKPGHRVSVRVDEMLAPSETILRDAGCLHTHRENEKAMFDMATTVNSLKPAVPDRSELQLATALKQADLQPSSGNWSNMTRTARGQAAVSTAKNHMESLANNDSNTHSPSIALPKCVYTGGLGFQTRRNRSPKQTIKIECSYTGGLGLPVNLKSSKKKATKRKKKVRFEIDEHHNEGSGVHENERVRTQGDEQRENIQMALMSMEDDERMKRRRAVARL